METLNDLRALLLHEVKDLKSAEDQIIEALPTMIEKAKEQKLKKALRDHLAITKKQRARLDHVEAAIKDSQEDKSKGENKGFLSGIKSLFDGEQKCKGIEGIISEGEKMMSTDMAPSVMDAAIIGSAQKVEHYEICGYGTAKAFALELGLTEAARLLDETLNEEYEADDLLTNLAERDVNKKAEGRNTGSTAKKAYSSAKKAAAGSNSKSNSTPKKAATASKSTNTKAAAKKSNATAKKAATSGKKK